MMADRVVKMDVLFPCPGCSITCGASLKDARVMHPKPECEMFTMLEPDEFLKAAREQLEKVRSQVN